MFLRPFTWRRRHSEDLLSTLRKFPTPPASSLVETWRLTDMEVAILISLLVVRLNWLVLSAVIPTNCELNFYHTVVDQTLELRWKKGIAGWINHEHWIRRTGFVSNWAFYCHSLAIGTVWSEWWDLTTAVPRGRFGVTGSPVQTQLMWFYWISPEVNNEYHHIQELAWDMKAIIN